MRVLLSQHYPSREVRRGNLPSHSVLALVIDDEPEFYSDVFTMRPQVWDLPQPPAPGDYRERGLRLRHLGYTPTRTFKRLRREYPSCEWHELKRAAGLDKPHKQTQPLWAAIGRPPMTPVSVRSDPRKHDPVKVTVRTVEWEELMATYPKERFDRELREAYERARAKHVRQAELDAARILVLHPQLKAMAEARLAEIKREVKERLMS